MDIVTELAGRCSEPDLQMMLDSLFQSDAREAETPRLMQELASMVPADDKVNDKNKVPVVGKSESK